MVNKICQEAYDLTYMKSSLYKCTTIFNLLLYKMEPLVFFKCLADETRLKALMLISLRGALCVCDIQCCLNLSQPKISRHLSELRKCNIVVTSRKGKWVYYQLNPELPVWAKEVLTKVTLDQQTDLQACLDTLEN